MMLKQGAKSKFLFNFYKLSQSLGPKKSRNMQTIQVEAPWYETYYGANSLIKEGGVMFENFTALRQIKQTTLSKKAKLSPLMDPVSIARQYAHHDNADNERGQQILFDIMEGGDGANTSTIRSQATGPTLDIATATGALSVTKLFGQEMEIIAEARTKRYEQAKRKRRKRKNGTNNQVRLR